MTRASLARAVDLLAEVVAILRAASDAPTIDEEAPPCPDPSVPVRAPVRASSAATSSSGLSCVSGSGDKGSRTPDL